MFLFTKSLFVLKVKSLKGHRGYIPLYIQAIPLVGYCNLSMLTLLFVVSVQTIICLAHTLSVLLPLRTTNTLHQLHVLLVLLTLRQFLNLYTDYQYYIV